MPPPAHVHPGRLVVSKPDLPMPAFGDFREAAATCPHNEHDKNGMPVRCRQALSRCRTLDLVFILDVGCSYAR